MKEKEQESIEFPEQKITNVQMAKEVKKSFIEYAMSVIVSRALPDARDGLKPVHRRILYAMYEDGLTHDKPYRKSATTVGNVLGRYHPHGDSAVYDAMVRLAQDFSLRYPLIDGHGNFGDIDGDDAAAYRYTEARMSKLADLMLSDIKKDVVDFDPNFDNKLKEPHVLPSRFPNLLVNGSVGIAVGMATNIPPHNLREVIDGTVYLMEHPDATIPDLMQFIKGPDFPTGATIYGSNGIKEAYLTGRGRITVRAKAKIEEDARRIVFTEIPYAVNKANLDKSIGDCAREKRIEGITAVRDESGRDGLRIVVEYKKDVNGQIILNQLYKYTQLQDTFAVNMLALVDNVPKILNLNQLLEIYIAHQENVIIRRIQFDLNKALRDAHLNEGYKVAIDNIDEVIRIIRSSSSVQEAKEALMKAFTADDVDNLIGEGGKQGLSDVQAQAIVEMQLGRLAGLERKKIEETLASLMQTIARMEEYLHDEAKIKEIIKKELIEIREKFGDDRRTELVQVENEIMLEDLIERHTCVITMTRDGYIKRQDAREYTAQRRGGKGVIGMATKEEDFVINVTAVNSHSCLMLFTNLGKVHTIRAFRVPEPQSRNTKGTHVRNIAELAPDENVTAMVSINNWKDGGYLTMITKNGIVKRTPVSEFEYQRRGGKIAITLDDGDELLHVCNTHGGSDLVVATRQGYAVRFCEDEVRPMGRTARGVTGIRPGKGDFVVGVALVDEGKSLVTITDRGYGKRTEFEEFRAAHRGGKGVKVHGLSDKTGLLTTIASVSPSDDIMIITNTGKIIRMPVDGINVYSRSAGGVIVMRFDDADAFIVNFSPVKSDEELDAETDAAASDENDSADADDGADIDSEDSVGDDAAADADSDETV